MNKQEIMVGIVLDEHTTLTFTEVCQHAHISEEMLMDWIMHGLLGEVTPPLAKRTFDANLLTRIHTAHRLHRDLEVNMQGAILALDLLDEIATLRNELAILRRSTG